MKTNKEFNPGSDFDIIVAEKVMGWKVLSHWEPNVIKSPIDENQCEVHPPVCMAYSTNIEDAWEVIERLRDPKRVFSLSSVVDHRSDGPHLMWVGKWEMHDPDYRFEFAFHESASMAICLASLRAVGRNNV